MIQGIDIDKFLTKRKFSIKNYIPHFIRNVWYFRKELNQFRPWDWTYNISMFRRSLELLQVTLEKGYEVEHTRLPKVEAMKEAICILKEIEMGSHYDRALDSLNYKDKDVLGLSSFMFKKLNERSIQIEQNDWDRLIKIIRDDNKGLMTWWD
jgi:hypothetical protein